MIKVKATVYCDSVNCDVNQTILVRDVKDALENSVSVPVNEFQRLGWHFRQTTAVCPRCVSFWRDNPETPFNPFKNSGAPGDL